MSNNIKKLQDVIKNNRIRTSEAIEKAGFLDYKEGEDAIWKLVQNGKVKIANDSILIWIEGVLNVYNFKTNPFVYYSINCDLNNHTYIQDKDRLDNKVFATKNAAIEYIKWWTDTYKSKIISSIIIGSSGSSFNFKEFEYLGFYKGLIINHVDNDEIKVIYSIKERKKEETIKEINVDGKIYSRTETVYTEWAPVSGLVKEFCRYICINREELDLINE